MRAMAIAAAVFALSGCATPPAPPAWSAADEKNEAEYLPFLSRGSASLRGQAFLTQAGGRVVTAAGRTVTLDPATTVGREWWQKAGKLWVHRTQIPPSAAFAKARRTTVADADGRFTFRDLPAGAYYLRTEVTWEIGGYNPTQGGLVGRLVDVPSAGTAEVVLSTFAE